MSNAVIEKIGNDSPLVSVVVITYNSKKYVIETLESIKQQSYKNIELIISDDCSTDDTIEICQAWVEINKERFVRTKVITVAKNTGVSLNCNRGFMAACGEWIKLIAGDDLLLDDGIEIYLDYVLKNNNIKVVVSDLKFIGEKSGVFHVPSSINNLTAYDQLKTFLIDRNSVPSIGPSGFYHRETLVEIGGYNLCCSSIEDYPLSMKFLENGIKIYALNHICVAYRINKGSISTDKKFYLKYIEMYQKCAVPIIKKNKWFLILYHFYIVKILSNNSNKFLKIKAVRYFLKSTSIYFWREYLKRYGKNI